MDGWMAEHFGIQKGFAHLVQNRGGGNPMKLSQAWTNCAVEQTRVSTHSLSIDVIVPVPS